MEQRIIKFKAKSIYNNEWVYGDLLHKADGTYIFIGNGENGHILCPKVDPSTVCQFTGLKDKNGEEVWEHDLLKFITEREVIIGSTGIFLKRETHLLPLRETTIKDDKLVRWSNHGSKFDRKEGEKNDEEKNI